MFRAGVRALLLAVCLASGAALAAQAKRTAAPPAALTETQKIVHTLNRFAFGAPRELIEKVRQRGLEAWFEEQVAGRVRPCETLGRILYSYETLHLSNQEILRRFNRPLLGKPTPRQRREYNRRRNVPRVELRNAVVLRAIFGANQVLETACDFFRNHFNVDANKNQCRFFAATWERDVIRAEALGNFGRMLVASARHPAMLIYLDNALSRKPLTKHELKVVARKVRQKTGSRRRGREAVEIAKQRGLNENYARELLELHTLGVDRYYTQRDVVNVARALTGWTVQMNPKKPVEFLFRQDLHQEGPKFFLGRGLAERKKNPAKEGEIILERLIRHPGTARFLAWKLCRYYVNDRPPADLVQRVAKVFRQTRGDLPSVYRALFEDLEFFHPRNYRAKFKRPFEYIVSAIRVVRAEVRHTGGIHRYLGLLNEPVYACQDPTGYYDQAEAWQDPGVMAIRWEFALGLASDKIPGVRLTKDFYARLDPGAPPVEWQKALARRVLPGGLSSRTSRAVEGAIQAYLHKNRRPDPRRLGPVILALLLGSPDFQRQ